MQDIKMQKREMWKIDELQASIVKSAGEVKAQEELLAQEVKVLAEKESKLEETTNLSRDEILSAEEFLPKLEEQHEEITSKEIKTLELLVSKHTDLMMAMGTFILEKRTEKAAMDKGFRNAREGINGSLQRLHDLGGQRMEVKGDIVESLHRKRKLEVKVAKQVEKHKTVSENAERAIQESNEVIKKLSKRARKHQRNKKNRANKQVMLQDVN